jgi:hypothetical protein
MPSHQGFSPTVDRLDEYTGGVSQRAIGAVAANIGVFIDPLQS